MFVTARPKLKRLRTILVVATLAMIVGGAALSLRDALSAAKEQRTETRRTLDAYAHFASYLFATRVYLDARDRTVMQAFARLHPEEPWSGPLPPPSVIPAVPDTSEVCAHAKDWPIYRFRMDFPSRSVTFIGGMPAPVAMSLIRDSIPKLAVNPWIRLYHFGYVFVDAPGFPESIAYTPITDAGGRLLAVYGYRSCYGSYDVWDFAEIHRVVKIVPPFLTAGMPPDSILAVQVTSASGHVLYRAPARSVPVRALGSDTVPEVSSVVVTIGLRPRVASMLVLGGVPRSRLPDSFLVLVGSIVFALATLAMLASEFRLVESRERFLANVSHELRTPLQHILLFVQILRLKRTRNDAERDKAVEVIETETQRLIRLTDNILAGVRNRRPHIALSHVDVPEIARAAAELCEPLAEARAMKIALDSEPAVARADAESLKQVLVNLIDNAVKYGPNGQTIWIGVRSDSDAVHAWVEDSGPGIPLGDRDRVWDAFVRLDRPDDATAGTGIGLTIARDLMRQMNGSVAMHKAAGGGVRVSLYLQRWTAESKD